MGQRLLHEDHLDALLHRVFLRFLERFFILGRQLR